MFDFKKHRFVIIIVAVLLCVFSLSAFRLSTKTPDWTTTTVERGDVRYVVAVSGLVSALDEASLSFPMTGIVTDVFVKKGDIVEAGQLLATLGAEQLVAERAAASASLSEARAGENELLAGPTSETRAVTEATVKAAEDALRETISTEAKKVRLAKAELLSQGLEAVTLDPDEDATAPAVSGNYNCSSEGVYKISLYRSGTDSGYSYRVSGLENGTGPVSVDQPTPLGQCGLYLQFTAGDQYANSEWQVSIPNTRSSTYLTYKNAYDLALRQEEQNVAAAQNTLNLAKNEATAANAAPRVESLIKANAAIRAAEARISAVDAQIRDLSIIAPFSGIITEVNIVKGETSSNSPVITLLGNQTYEIIARIPEIDINKVSTGQSIIARFDADSESPQTGRVSFVSPLPTIIDGVAYFDANIILDNTPTWIKPGFNADIDIITKETKGVLRLPTRFLIDNTYVLTPQGNKAINTPLEVGMVGNDGYAEISGLSEGALVIAPDR